jgi:hypothetical protein
VTHDRSIRAHTEPRQRPGLADQQSRRRPALAPPTLGPPLGQGAPKPAQRFSQGLGPAPPYTAPTAPVFETGDKRYACVNKVQPSRDGHPR